ncbi:MAG TPA: DUF2784 domain-containing protein [Gemmatimonadales bacterium]|nr:DUF2784 domain-containing protein [Gemmatimonadales bacterium]
MAYRLAANGVVLVHVLFVMFVVCGGFLVRRWPRLALVHLPAAAWGVAIEWGGWICPLTPLENALRGRAGLAGYPGGFIEHYVMPLLYPVGLERTTQAWLGAFAFAVNVVAYGVLLWHRRSRDPSRERGSG